MPFTYGGDSLPARAELSKIINWRFVGNPGEPEFYSNWSNVGGTYLPVGFTEIAGGLIGLRGCAKQEGGAVSMFVLPPEFRPHATEIFLSGMGNSLVSVVIQASGLVHIASVAGGPTSDCQVSLSGIYFAPKRDI